VSRIRLVDLDCVRGALLRRSILVLRLMNDKGRIAAFTKCNYAIEKRFVIGARLEARCWLLANRELLCFLNAANNALIIFRITRCIERFENRTTHLIRF